MAIDPRRLKLAPPIEMIGYGGTAGRRLGTGQTEASPSTRFCTADGVMLNIPTDLLRTLVAVVDMRSFTKAARVLGVTQPAVSAQIKRLQFLLGYELLDKRTPGVTLTPRGEIVVGHARRLLVVNDEILQSTRDGRVKTLQIGIPPDYGGSRIPAMLACFRSRWPDVNFNVNSGSPESLLRDVKQGDLDVALVVTESEPSIEPRHSWRREAVWVRSEATKLDPHRPVPLVSYAEDCASQRVTIATLREAGWRFELVFSSRSLASLAAAVEAGFGVMAVPRGRAIRAALHIWDDAPLPKLPALYVGIFVREGGNRQAVDEFADQLSELRVLPGQPESADAVAPLRALEAR
ncbi:MAG TPA: LysR family transcriptional regulator [Xanthobacteraceae bacterium]